MLCCKKGLLFAVYRVVKAKGEQPFMLNVQTGNGPFKT